MAAGGAGPQLGGTRDFDATWASAAARLEAGDYKTALTHLEKVARHRKALGTPNFFAMADVVLIAAKKAAEEGMTAEAADLLDLAEQLAPWHPSVPLARAAISYELDGPSAEQLGLLNRSLGLQLMHLPSRVTLFGRLAAIGLLSILWAVVLFGLLMLARHGSRLAHDTGHLLPPSIRGAPLAVLGIVVLVVAPLSIGVGLVLMALAWCVVLWPYLSMPERIVGAILALLVALTPALNGRFEAALSFPGSAQETAWLCSYGRCTGPRKAALVEETRDGDADPAKVAALALARKRQGSASGKDGSVELFKAKEALKKLKQGGDTSYATLLNDANVRYAYKNVDCSTGGAPPSLREIEELYGEAGKKAPSDGGVEVAYNKGVLLAQSGEPEKSGAALARAMSIDESRVKATRADAGPPSSDPCPRHFNANLSLMDVLPATAPMASEVAAAFKGNGRILAPFGYLLAGIVDGAFMPLLGIVCGGLLLLGAALVSVLRPAYPCSECGRVACGRCRRELRSLDLCERCLYLKIKGAFVDSRDKWLRDRGIAEAADRKRLLTRVASFVVPGSGHMLRGRVIVGALVQWVFLYGLLMVFASDLLIPETELVGRSQLILSLYAGTAAVAAYAVSAIDIVVRD